MTAPRILVVDDEPNIRDLLITSLRFAGFQVRAVSNGAQTISAVLEEEPDLIVLDVMMPGMDGFSLLAEVKQRPELLRLPVVFLTAAQDRELLLRAFDAGAVDYVTKPFMPEELLARVDAHIGLKLTRDRLERVAKERQELVNLVAHDLKNPLSSVLFASDILLQDGTRPERVPRYLQMIHDSAMDAIGYIRRYLEIQADSHSAREREARDQAYGELPPVIGWLAERYGLQLEARGRQLHVRPLPQRCRPVAMDALVLRQVSENLITNAMKYAPASDIDLTVRAGARGFWQLLVEDRGPGIPAAKQRELFKPFVRLSDEDRAQTMSSGLGLSLARQIVATAGGQLWYEDREGGGARFILELPEARSGEH